MAEERREELFNVTSENTFTPRAFLSILKLFSKMLFVSLKKGLLSHLSHVLFKTIEVSFYVIF